MQDSATLFQQAQDYIPGGVNSPVRAFKAVGGTPPFIKSAAGAYITDYENKTYLDYVGSWGPAILGHANPVVIQEVSKAIKNGLSFGAPTAKETELAQLIQSHMPSLEKIRLVNSGTEATMSAIRLARGVTSRKKIIKFEGCYHGHSDSLLVNAGSGALTCGTPSSPGVTEATAQDTLTATFNDIDSVKALFNEYPDDIAAVIVEPITGNMNLIRPTHHFLENLRMITTEHNSLLIFDEVMTGFRVALGGAQSLYNIKPDITTLGKVIGGGLPIGAFGGSQAIMDYLAPNGPVYQAGTLSGNPICVTAGLATLKQLDTSSYLTLNAMSKQLMQGFQSAADSAKVPLSTQYVGGMFGFVFNAPTHGINQFNDVKKANNQNFIQFFNTMLNNNIYLAPSPYEAGFISLAHTQDNINNTIAIAEKAYYQLSHQ